MNDDYFGLGAGFEDAESSNHLSSIFGFLIRLVLAITTAGFFFVYAGNLFAWLVGYVYSPYFSAVVGTFCVDVLAWAWSYLREKHATTETQISAAKWATVGNAGLSALVTVVFFILLTDFVATHHSDGTLNNIGLIVNMAGLLVGTVAIAGNGMVWVYYQSNSTNSRRNLDNAKLRAARMKGQFAIDQQQNRLVIERTIEQIKAQLPDLANAAGDTNAGQYLRERFRQIDANGDGRLTDNEVRAWVDAHPDEARRLAVRANGNGHSSAPFE